MSGDVWAEFVQLDQFHQQGQNRDVVPLYLLHEGLGLLVLLEEVHHGVDVHAQHVSHLSTPRADQPQELADAVVALGVVAV